MYLQAGSAGELGRSRGLEQIGFWRKILEHPAYDAFWRDQAVDRILAAQPLTVPVMLVHGLWDQEDIYGAIAVYKAHRAEGHRQRQGVPRDGPLVPRAADRRRQRARRPEVRQRHRPHVPAGDPAAVPRPVPQGRRAEGGHRARVGVRDRHEHVAASAGLAGRVRERLRDRRRRRSTWARASSWASPRRRPAAPPSKSTSPIRPSPCRSGRAPFSRWVLRLRSHVAAMAGRRSARGVRPPRRRRRSSRTCSPRR